MQKYSKTIFTILVLCSFFMGVFPSHALANAASSPGGDTVQVGLSVNCSKLPTSPEGLKVLADHHLCGQGATTNGASDSVTDDCGMLTLKVTNDGAGKLGVHVTVTAAWYMGPFYKLGYAGGWNNESTNSSGSIGDVKAETNSTITSDTQYYTDTGHVVASLDWATATNLVQISCTNASLLVADTQVTI